MNCQKLLLGSRIKSETPINRLLISVNRPAMESVRKPESFGKCLSRKHDDTLILYVLKDPALSLNPHDLFPIPLLLLL
jgi:hypothetical protein